jgi:hypothetical protein
MLRCLGDRKAFFPRSRVVDHNPCFSECFQNNIMRHVPVQNRWQAQLAQVMQLDAQRPACESEVSCYPFEVAKADAL